jgi:hypothetical protein
LKLFKLFIIFDNRFYHLVWSPIVLLGCAEALILAFCG